MLRHTQIGNPMRFDNVTTSTGERWRRERKGNRKRVGLGRNNACGIQRFSPRKGVQGHTESNQIIATKLQTGCKNGVYRPELCCVSLVGGGITQKKKKKKIRRLGRVGVDFQSVKSEMPPKANL